MARGTQLGALIADLRAATNQSTSAALGVSVLTFLKETLQRHQRFLWNEYDWPFLRNSYNVNAQAGSRYYDVPAGLVLERVETVEYKFNGKWGTVYQGISTAQYNQYDPVADERSSPVTHWDPYIDGQFEIWPLPENNGITPTEEDSIRLTGIRDLSVFVDDADTADIDGDLLLLFAKAEILTGQKDRRAPIVSQQAAALFERLKGRLGSRQIRIMNGRELQSYRPGVHNLQARWTP